MSKIFHRVRKYFCILESVQDAIEFNPRTTKKIKLINLEFLSEILWM